MKIIILIILFASTLLSQKLWEIEVNPNDLLRDVMEIPNSDLLLFTYNSGKLEIRNSNDGSLVRDVIRPQGEKGGYNISGLGNSYYFSERGDYEPGKEETYLNDTIFVYDLFSDEIINRISFDVGQYKSQSNFISKTLKYNFTPDMTKVFGKIGYNFNDGPGFNFFFVYDINQREFIYTEEVNKLKVSQYGEFTSPGFYLETYRASPDSKYIILNGKDNGDGKWDEPENETKMLNIQNLQFIDLSSKVYPNGTFIEPNKMVFRTPKSLLIYSFPELESIENIVIPEEYNFSISGTSRWSLCEEILFIHVYKRIEGMQNKFENWYLALDRNNLNIIFDSRLIHSNFKYSNSYSVNNCSLLIVDRDFDNREGIITCYNFQTLNIETEKTEHNYFSKTDSIINFNSQEFIGQIINIEIYNSAGAKVGTIYNGVINQPNYNFNIPELPSGAYYIQCQLPNQNLNFNFVVVR